MIHRISVVIATLKLTGIIILFIPSLAMAGATSSTSSASIASDSIHFIALPYLNASHYDNNQQLLMLNHAKNRQHLSDYNWIIVITSIADFNTNRDNLQLLDPYHSADARLATDHHSIIIPVPEQAALQLPLHNTDSNSTPLWLQYLKAGKTTWHTPMLTPRVAIEVRSEQQKTNKMAERMAERAFYFGYDTNHDALE